jgi:acyl-CoA synthetase (AMP-forming)/AMP-acid ligase II
MTSSSNIVDLLSEQFVKKKDNIAVIYLERGESELCQLTFKDLKELSQLKAAFLTNVISSNSLMLNRPKAILIFQFGPEFLTTLLACFFSGIVAVPVPYPRPGESLRRLNNILKVSNAEIIISDCPFFEQYGEGVKDKEYVKITEKDFSSYKKNAPVGKPFFSENSPVIMQFTSGSTSSPKGVVLTSKSIISNSFLVKQGMDVNNNSIFLNWMPHYHDMGLLGSLLYPILLGCKSIQMAPLSFVQKPIRWLKAIDKYQATISGGPLFSFSLCTSNIQDEKLNDIDLSCWKTAFCGAEPIFHKELDKFRVKFKKYGLVPENVFGCYGMAEASLYIAGTMRNGKQPFFNVDDIENIEPCLMNNEMMDSISLVDIKTGNEILSDNVSGEIYFSHSSNGIGYYENGFVDDVNFSLKVSEENDRKYLKTGDIGFKIDNQLYVTGRIKDIVIINGANYSAPEVEWLALSSIDELNPLAAVFFVLTLVDGSKKSILLAESKGKTIPEDTALILKRVNKILQIELGIVVTEMNILPRGFLPKTTSGKVQRILAKKIFLEGGLV